MSTRITWSQSTETDVASYDIERAVSIAGPWEPLASILNDVNTPNYDTVAGLFFFDDSTGNSASWYRITARDNAGQLGTPSVPFRAGTDTSALLPSLVGVVTVSAGDVGVLLNLGFTTIEIWGSEDNGGNWEELTAASIQEATVSSIAATTTFYIPGGTLLMKFADGITRGVDFTAPFVWWSPQQVVDRINQVLPVASLDGRQVVLRTLDRGRTASIQVLSCPAALGFPLDKTFGKDARLSLIDGTPLYQYYDVQASKTSRYRWRFSKNGADPVSNFSDYVLPRTLAVSTAYVSLAVASFMNVDGTPAKTTVIVAPESPTNLSGFSVNQKTLTFESDENGLVQFALVQGSKVRIAIEGGISRVITVPSTPSFDLLAALSDAPDEFTVQEIPALLTRTTL